MQPNEKIERNRKKMIIDNFLGGISWSLGVFAGGTIVVAILIFIFSKVNLVPIFGGFLSDVTKNVLQSNSELLK